MHRERVVDFNSEDITRTLTALTRASTSLGSGVVDRLGIARSKQIIAAFEDSEGEVSLAVTDDMDELRAEIMLSTLRRLYAAGFCFLACTPGDASPKERWMAFDPDAYRAHVAVAISNTGKIALTCTKVTFEDGKIGFERPQVMPGRQEAVQALLGFDPLPLMSA